MPTRFLRLERQDFWLAPFWFYQSHIALPLAPSTVFKFFISIILKKFIIMPTRFLRLERQDFWLAPYCWLSLIHI